MSLLFPTEAGLRPADIYGGPNGALAQLKRLEAWFAAQRDFCFYSSSVLIIYEVRLLSVPCAWQWCCTRNPSTARCMTQDTAFHVHQEQAEACAVPCTFALSREKACSASHLMAGVTGRTLCGP